MMIVYKKREDRGSSGKGIMCSSAWLKLEHSRKKKKNKKDYMAMLFG